MKSRVLLGMSGGIDSTVSALLLLEQGYEVVGVTFRTFDSIKESCLRREKGCCSVESIMEARENARKMGFEHHIVDFRDIFRDKVISNFIDEYMSGRTPNPCVLCNSFIKWGEMLRLADELGCEKIATGHYARIAERKGHLYLRRAADVKKDQTYFLWRLTEENLRRTLFPIGDITKEQVRDIARQHGYEKLAVKAESQEICFVTDNDYRSFLRENVADYDKRVHEGAFVDAERKRVGTHCGFPNYTIGQRKGLGIALGKPVYVTDINAQENIVALGDYNDLYRQSVRVADFRVRDAQWLTDDPICMAMIRYRSKPQKAEVKCRLSSTENILSSTENTERTENLLINAGNSNGEDAELVFDNPVWGAAPGQSAVLYKDDLLVGGGVIY